MIRHFPFKEYSIYLTYSLMLMSLTPAVNAISLKLTENINLSGSLRHQISYTKSDVNPAVVSNTSSVNLNAASFLWQPWIATVDTSLTLSYTNRQNGGDLSGQSINGGVNLNIFPQSHFPLTTYFRRANSQVDGDLLNQDITTTRFGFRQAYSTKAIRLNISYEHLMDKDESINTSLDDRTNEDIQDNLELTISTTLGEHEILGRSRLAFVERNTPPVRNDQILHILQHNYRPGQNFSVNNLFTYTDRNIEQSPGAETDLMTIQLNSNMFWRPQSYKKLQVTASSLLQGSGNSEDNVFGVFDNAGLSAQASYQWNPFLNFRAQTTFNASADNTRTSQRIGADYSPADRELFGFRHSYNLNVGATNNIGDANLANQDFNLQGGHFFSRQFPLAVGNISMTVTQRASTLLDSNGKLDRTLTHSFGTGWNTTTDNTTNFISLNLSDTRRFSNESDEFGQQLANLQFTRNHRLSRNSTINGNITMQANRALDDSNDDGDNWNFNTSASLSYNHSTLFHVPNLRLQSDIRYLSDSLFSTINSDGLNDLVRNDIYWQNRLDYYIGRLNFRLSGIIGQSDGAFNNSIFFSVQRDFGG